MGFGARIAVLIAFITVLVSGAFYIGQQYSNPSPVGTPPPPATLPVNPPPSPTPTPSPTSGIPGGPIGFVGCSNIRDTVQGYRAVGGKRIWNPTTDKTYGGGTPVAWAKSISDPNLKYWDEFDVMNKANPGAKTLWMGLCLRAVESDQASYNGAVATIDEVKRKIPGVTIYVSALNGFVEPHVCGITGKNGPLRAQLLANRLVKEGRAKTGPDVGDLISDDQIPSTGATAQNTETVSDGCHPSPQRGEPKLGRELLKFFN
ncbi:MAG: hypothetical protein G01um101419_320 [Parcubacteria group bacterium Gr01-1014_19]|nr:MAG: hypothetical protein G01um101419_320 [Parcubacteria group bacterium Gr01-1014_19]